MSVPLDLQSKGTEAGGYTPYIYLGSQTLTFKSIGLQIRLDGKLAMGKLTHWLVLISPLTTLAIRDPHGINFIDATCDLSLLVLLMGKSMLLVRTCPIDSFCFLATHAARFLTALRVTIRCKTRDGEIYGISSIDFPIHLFARVLQMAWFQSLQQGCGLLMQPTYAMAQFLLPGLMALYTLFS